ncbi:MAG: hypothetical protein AAB638_01495 [Patescibacteria group bacterium]
MTYRPIISLLLSALIIGNITFLALSPAPASAASIKSNAAAFAGCYTGASLAPYLSIKINEGLAKLNSKAEEFLNGALGKIFGGIFGNNNNPLGGVAGGLTVPVSDSNAQKAIAYNTAVFNTVEYRNVIIARCLARQIMIAMNKNALQVVRTAGRDGGPTYIKNWTNFQTNAQYRGENIFRAELSTAHLCDYLASDVKKSFGVDPKTKTPITGQNTRTDSLQPFNLTTKCTLPAGFSMEKYQNDFAGNGGWNTFLRLLEPQNNISGLIALSQDEIQKQRSLAVSSDVNQVIANGGYLGISGNGKANSCLVKAKTGECIVYGDIKTPGSYLAANVQASVMSEFQWLTSAQGLNTIISTATEVLLNRLLDFGNTDEGSYRQTNDGDKEPSKSTLPTDPTDPDNPGGVCSNTGNGIADYSSVLGAAILTTLRTNPIADSFNTPDKGFLFLTLVSAHLSNAGFLSTTNVKNGNNNPNQGDLIAIWKSGDATIERYDVIKDLGTGTLRLKDAIISEYTGDVALSCLVGDQSGPTPTPSGVGGGETPDPTPFF